MSQFFIYIYIYVCVCVCIFFFSDFSPYYKIIRGILIYNNNICVLCTQQVLHSRSFLVVYFIYSNVYVNPKLLIYYSYTIPY